VRERGVFFLFVFLETAAAVCNMCDVRCTHTHTPQHTTHTTRQRGLTLLFRGWEESRRGGIKRNGTHRRENERERASEKKKRKKKKKRERR
jgi:hypothetical protein